MHCYTQNIKEILWDRWLREEDIYFFLFFHCKKTETNDPRDRATVDRGLL